MGASSYPMISAQEAWQHVRAQVSPLAPVSLPITRALGQVLAEEIVATENMPPFPSASMDGFAVLAEDAAPERRILGEQDAGSPQPWRVEPGTAVHIMTGAALPSGADAVIPVEYATVQGCYVRFDVAARTGDNVRPIGQDLSIGEHVLARGTLLGPAEIGLLATVGRVRVSVHPKPRVAVLATGDELVPPERTPGPGQIRDSNSYALLAAVEALGCRPIYLGLIPDNEEDLRRAILEAVASADLVITSGGVSMGTRDLVKPLLAELGTVYFGRVAIKPGKPLTFSLVQGVPVFGLPGFPVSSLVCFENFVRPALRLMAGHSALWRPSVQVRLAHAVKHAPDRSEYQRAVVSERDGEYWAETTGVQVSGRLRSLVGANALLVLPAGTGDLAAHEPVTAFLIDRPEVEQSGDVLR